MLSVLSPLTLPTIVLMLLGGAFVVALAAVIAQRLDLRPAAALFAAALVVTFAGAAWAQSSEETSIDLAPLVTIVAPYIVEGIVALVLLVVGWAARRFLGLEIEKRHREALDQALRAGAAWGLAKAKEHAAGKVSIDVKHVAVANALRYVLDATPDAIRSFGLTPERVKELIEARMAPTPFEAELIAAETKRVS